MKEKAKLNTKISYSSLFWLFMIGSLAGVIIEGIFCLIHKGAWESHVVSLFGPFNILYGAGICLFYIGAVKLKEKPIWLRVLIMAIAATLLELLCGLVLRFGLGMRAWNYKNEFLNYEGLICLNFTIAWAIAAFIFCIFEKNITNFLKKFQKGKWHILCILLTIFMIINLFLTSISIIRWSERHHGIEPTNTLEKHIDEKLPDKIMKKRYIEWRFLK